MLTVRSVSARLIITDGTTAACWLQAHAPEGAHVREDGTHVEAVVVLEGGTQASHVDLQGSRQVWLRPRLCF